MMRRKGKRPGGNKGPRRWAPSVPDVRDALRALYGPGQAETERPEKQPQGGDGQDNGDQ
jgi:hypothetical protein